MRTDFVQNGRNQQRSTPQKLPFNVMRQFIFGKPINSLAVQNRQTNKEFFSSQKKTRKRISTGSTPVTENGYLLEVERSDDGAALRVRQVEQRVQVRQESVANAHDVTCCQRDVIAEGTRILRLQ